MLHFRVGFDAAGDPVGLLWAPINRAVPISVSGCAGN